MPFNKKGKWENPGKIDPKDFLMRLEYEKGEVTVPESVKRHLDTFVKTTLEGADKLVSSNEKSFKSLKSLAHKGIQPVDIILPVYDGLHVVKLCVDSVRKRTVWPYHLTIINDKSPDPEIEKYLSNLEISSDYPVTILRNNVNKGFATSVNRGIKNTSNPYICVLNSDVIVTDGWLTKMVAALEANPSHKMVNPATNNTALIDVPMQENFSYKDMNRALSRVSPKEYPQILPTGFCLMFPRDLTRTIGLFDEGYTHGYGEETDAWMKTISRVNDGEYSRWCAVLADDAYVFHERGSSFSALGTEQHDAIRKAGSSRFHQIWPGFRQWQRGFDVEKVLSTIRSKIPEDHKARSSPYNVSFVVHSTGISGGMSVITDIINELVERDIEVNLSVIRRDKNAKVPGIGNLRISPTVFESYDDFIENFSERVFDKGILIASTIELAPPILNLSGDYERVLFAQSDDHSMVNETDDEDLKALVDKTYEEVPHIISGSAWVDEKIRTQYNRSTLGFLRPGLNTDLFHPRDRTNRDDRPTVLFSLLSSYGFKGAARGVETAKDLIKICKRHNKDIRVMAYGPKAVHDCPEIIGLGIVSQSRLANLLGTEVDVFCDPSHIHSYGLPSLEALASGVTPICWDNKGIREYADETNSIILPENAPPSTVAGEIYNYLFNKEKFPPCDVHTRKDFVERFIDCIEQEFKLVYPKKVVNVVTPHLRKHGGPTTILRTAEILKESGHDVRLYSIYPDISPEVLGDTEIPVYLDWKEMRPCDALITNSDNPQNKLFSELQTAKKKVLLKLSHNARFQQLENDSLTYNWDHVVTSTNWLKEACEVPLVDQGWTHPPVNATRVGWYHYSHNTFSCPPNMRTYGSLNTSIKVAFLAHHHKLKGTNEAITTMVHLKNKYKEKVEIIAIGEWPEFAKLKPAWVKYAFNPSRKVLAETLKQTDIWLTSSFTEGLGRMALEAMSSSCAVVLTDTGVEYAEKNKNCLIAGRGNVAQMVKHIDSLITDQDLFKTIITNGFETACRYADSSSLKTNLNEVIV